MQAVSCAWVLPPVRANANRAPGEARAQSRPVPRRRVPGHPWVGDDAASVRQPRWRQAKPSDYEA